jgi:hypothetical protein
MGREEEGCTQRREWLLRGGIRKEKERKIRYDVLIRLE